MKEVLEDIDDGGAFGFGVPTTDGGTVWTGGSSLMEET